MAVIEAKGLSKQYPNGRGIFQIDLSVEQGEIFGFLGPNGAGKSTTIRTLMGFLHPQSGAASILGHDVVRDGLAVRRLVGYLPSEITLYDDLTGEQQIAFSLKVRGQQERMAQARQLAQRLGVELNRRVRTLSRGQKQKVAIVTALAHDPQVLIMDEPTTGLDPLAQEIFHTLLREEAARGKTVFISSHILSEVEGLCDRVAIIRDGRIVTTDTVSGLKTQRMKHIRVEFGGAVPDLASLPGVTELKQEGQRVRFTLVGGLDPVLAMLSAHRVIDLTVQDPSLEEIFMAFYTGQEVTRR